MFRDIFIILYIKKKHFMLGFGFDVIFGLQII